MAAVAVTQSVSYAPVALSSMRISSSCLRLNSRPFCHIQSPPVDLHNVPLLLRPDQFNSASNGAGAGSAPHGTPEVAVAAVATEGATKQGRSCTAADATAARIQQTVTRLVDLRELNLTPEQRTRAVEEVSAGAKAGFFHVKNFGVSEDTMDRLRKLSTDYFSKKLEDPNSFSGSATIATIGGKMGFNHRFNTTEHMFQMHRMTFKYQVVPQENKTDFDWPSDDLRDAAMEYGMGVYRLGCFLADLLSEALGLPSSYIMDSMGKEGILRSLLIWYPLKTVTPRGNLALTPHSDVSVLDFVLPSHVPGLQFFVEGQYVDVPLLGPYALCVNIGDVLETISNGRFFSAPHRVLLGPEDRMSFVSTLDPLPDAVLEPDSSLISDEYPALYRSRTYRERSERLYTSKNFCIDDFTKLYMFRKPEYLDKRKNLYPVSDRAVEVGIASEAA